MFDEKMSKFLHSQHIMHLGVIASDAPYCATCFYAFSQDELALVFASDTNTTHAKAMLNAPVAASVALDTKVVGRIQGVQIKGSISPASKKQKEIYFSRFGFARLLSPTLWALEISWAKMTDNTLGFGKKLLYLKPA